MLFILILLDAKNRLFCFLQDAAAVVSPDVAAPDTVAAKAGDGDRGDASGFAQQAETASPSSSSKPAAAITNQDSAARSSSSMPASEGLPEAVVGGNAATARRMDTSEVGGGVSEGQGEVMSPVPNSQVSPGQDAQRARVEGLPYERRTLESLARLEVAWEAAGNRCPHPTCAEVAPVPEAKFFWTVGHWFWVHVALAFVAPLKCYLEAVLKTGTQTCTYTTGTVRALRLHLKKRSKHLRGTPADVDEAVRRAQEAQAAILGPEFSLSAIHAEARRLQGLTGAGKGGSAPKKGAKSNPCPPKAAVTPGKSSKNCKSTTVRAPEVSSPVRGPSQRPVKRPLSPSSSSASSRQRCMPPPVLPITSIRADPREPGLTKQETVSQIRELEAAVAQEFQSIVEGLEAMPVCKSKDVGTGCSVACPGLYGITVAVHQAGQDVRRTARVMHGDPPAPKEGLYRHGLDDQYQQLREENARLREENGRLAAERQERREVAKELAAVRDQLRAARGQRGRQLGPGEVTATVRRERVADLETKLELLTREMSALLATFSSSR